MLLYRPLLTAYRQTAYPPVRRFLLREFAHPRLHAEPDEILEDLQQVREVSVVQVPERLSAEVWLRERLMRLRLTTGDTARQSGGIWTYHAQHRAVISWSSSAIPVPALTQAGGNWFGPLALSLVRRAAGPARAEALAALGDLGEDVGIGPLAEELLSGAMPEAAAVALARMGGAAAARTLQPALQARGVARCAPFLGVALRGLRDQEMLPLLEKLAHAPEAEAREAAAWAIGSYNPKNVQGVVDALKWETDSFVRLNLLASLGRLHLPGSLEIVKAFFKADETEIVRTAAIRAAGSIPDADAPGFLESVLRSGSAAERAEALQALVTLQVPGDPYLDQARRAASSTSGRLKLLGLLALVVWAPQDAMERVRAVFSGQPTGDWFLATYALRYLKAESGVRLLKRVCEATRGSELEEIAVDALARHMDRPGVVEFLFGVVKSDPRPAVLERVMRDLGRHLPAEDAMAAALQIRTLLDAAREPAVAGPLMVALGALGGPDDANRMLPFLEGEAAGHAIRGLELLMAESALPALHRVAARGDSSCDTEAVTALARLGDPGAADALERLASTPDGPARAARALVQIGVSVREVKAVRRLALLHAALQDRASAGAPGAAAAVDAPDVGTTSSPSHGSRAPSLQNPVTRRDFLELLDRQGDSLASLPLPRLTEAPPAGSGNRVYSELGQHLTGRRRSGANPRTLVLAFLILSACVALVWRYVRSTFGS